MNNNVEMMEKQLEMMFFFLLAYAELCHPILYARVRVALVWCV